MGPIDVQDIIFMVALQEEYQENFALVRGSAIHFHPPPTKI